jgi:hypothetical protein
VKAGDFLNKLEMQSSPWPALHMQWVCKPDQSRSCKGRPIGCLVQRAEGLQSYSLPIVAVARRLLARCQHLCDCFAVTCKANSPHSQWVTSSTRASSHTRGAPTRGAPPVVAARMRCGVQSTREKAASRPTVIHLEAEHCFEVGHVAGVARTNNDTSHLQWPSKHIDQQRRCRGCAASSRLPASNRCRCRQVKQGATPADGRQSTADTTPRTCGLSKTHLQATSAIVTPCFLATADSACSRLCRRRHSRLRLSTSTVDLWQLAGGHLLQRHGPACSSRPDQACPAASSCMPPQTARLSSTHPFQTHKQGFTWNQSQPPAWPMTEAYLDLE